MLARRPQRFTPMLAFVLACGHEEAAPPWPLPRVAAESEYIEYGTWADDTSLCMDDVLARLDRYIEDTADFLGVEPPMERIRYTWVPDSLQDADTWGCSEPSALGCHRRHAGKSFILANRFDSTHELAHAVDIAALGQTHRVLEEGLAMYLGNVYSTAEIISDFPPEFRAMLDRGGLPDYILSLHFVGSVIERDGVDKFKELRAQVPIGAGFADFAAVYLDVYGQDLDEALVEMTAPIHTRLQVPALCQGEPTPWVGGPDLEIKLRGHCGDGFFYGGGLVEGLPGFFKTFTIDVPVSGLYEMSVTGAGAVPDQIAGYLNNCPGVEPGLLTSLRGFSSKGLLHPGRHQVEVHFPHAAEPVGELTLTLRYEDPPPAEAPAPALD